MAPDRLKGYHSREAMKARVTILVGPRSRVTTPNPAAPARMQPPAVARSWVMIAALALVVTNCTETPEPPRESIPRGGTLRVALVNDPSPDAVPKGLDPQSTFSPDIYEVFRCCLLRTLLSYSGRLTGQGGALLRPDVAESLPEVSSDGLTWTFRLKQGLRYGPPLTNTEIVSSDFIRSLERIARVGLNSSYYSVIQGFEDVRKGNADSVTGLETPDRHTLVVHLTEPTGNFGYRMSLPETHPIPPGPSGVGVDAGREDYGPFLVSSGPYAVEGAEDLDFSVPPEEQQSASGFVKDSSLILVRNPSWRPATDPLRPAYSDRIEATFVPTAEEAAARVDRGEADVLMAPFAPPVVPNEMVEEYRRNPDLSKRLVVGSADIVRYASINVASPPFDDVHVRRAINYAVDKSRHIDIRGSPEIGRPAGHVIHDSMENNLLLNYDPYATPNSGGDLDRAREEMALSRYDEDGDGVCDDPSCVDVLALSFADPGSPGMALGEAIRSDLEPLGITLDLRAVPAEQFFPQVSDPRSHVALAIDAGWSKAFPNAEDFVGPLFSRSALEEGCCNYSLVGATPRQLRRWGYEVSSVPSVEDKIRECRSLVAIESIRCYAELDQLLMEQVVPWVPLMFQNQIYIVSSRVVAHSYDQFVALPALDRIALAPGTS
mgnify:CR=1 FL=1